jgi:hypothetical protein
MTQEVEEEIQKKEELLNVLHEIREALNKYNQNGDKFELFEPLDKILEPLLEENRKLKVLTKILEKKRNQIEAEALKKLFNIKINEDTLKYMEEFIDVADVTYVLVGGNKIYIDYEFKVPGYYITFLRFELRTDVINQYTYIFGSTDINESYQKILDSIVSLILDIKETVQFETS